MHDKVSPEAKTQALAVAKGIQKPGQRKEQTKLIAQGIAKGIAEYKKQQNKKSRERDKLQKTKSRQSHPTDPETEQAVLPPAQNSKLPWVLLVLSWLVFAIYIIY